MKTEAQNIIDELISYGVTKWKISTFCSVRWTSVQGWHRAWYNPRKPHMDKLLELLLLKRGDSGAFKS